MGEGKTLKCYMAVTETMTNLHKQCHVFVTKLYLAFSLLNGEAFPY